MEKYRPGGEQTFGALKALYLHTQKLLIMKAIRLLSIALAALMLAGATGCVSKKKYAELQGRYDTLNSNYNASQVSLAEANAHGKSLEQMLSDARRNNDQLQDALAQAMKNNSQGNVNIATLLDQIDKSNKYIRQLVEAKQKSDSLNMVLTTNLTRSLSPADMKDVNIKVLKGVVYISLADNMLFRSGSYEISPAAMSILGKIAKIIKDYNDYDVLVEGNTDNVPIKRTNIRNNWDLSCLRASSVVQVLQNDFDVNASRLTAGGRGEYNPVATNDTAEGRQLNRRTEIIITPKLDQFLSLIDKAPKEEQK